MRCGGGNSPWRAEQEFQKQNTQNRWEEIFEETMADHDFFRIKQRYESSEDIDQNK